MWILSKDNESLINANAMKIERQTSENWHGNIVDCWYDIVAYTDGCKSHVAEYKTRDEAQKALLKMTEAFCIKDNLWKF